MSTEIKDFKIGDLKYVKLKRDIKNNFIAEHVLFACDLLYHFGDGSNRLKRYAIKDLPELFGKHIASIYKSMSYLKENRILIKIGYEEFINPAVAYRCRETSYPTVYDMIINQTGIILDEEYFENLNNQPKAGRPKKAKKELAPVQVPLYSFKNVPLPSPDEE